GAGEERRDGGEGEEGVGELVEVGVYSGAGGAASETLRGGRGAQRTDQPCGFQEASETHVALQAVELVAGNIERAARDERQGDEVASGGGVGFDRVEVAGNLVSGAGFDADARAVADGGGLAELSHL